MTKATRRQPLRWYHRLCVKILSQGPIPYHVAFIMDGNRRHARSQHKPVISGHHDGYGVLLDVLEVCILLGIRVVTVYAFSVDNFSRSEEEVSGLMSLACDKLVEMGGHQDVLQRHDVQVRVLGDIAQLPLKLQQAVSTAEERTRDFRGARLNICTGYSGCEELCHMWGRGAADLLHDDAHHTKTQTCKAIDDTERSSSTTSEKDSGNSEKSGSGGKIPAQRSRSRPLWAASRAASHHSYLHPAHRCAHAGAPGRACVREGLSRVLEEEDWSVDRVADTGREMEGQCVENMGERVGTGRKEESHTTETPAAAPYLSVEDEQVPPRANSPCALWRSLSNAVGSLLRGWTGGEEYGKEATPHSRARATMLSHPRPALVLRTSGEQRLSDFLLAGSGVSQLQFCSLRWPEFTAWSLCEAVLRYQCSYASLHSTATTVSLLRWEALDADEGGATWGCEGCGGVCDGRGGAVGG